MSLVRMVTGLNRQRRLTHGTLALAAVAAYGAAKVYTPHGGVPYLLTIGMGYLSLLLMVVTLALGPLQLLRRRANPVNIDLRRDVGIWAALTGIVHVIAGLQIHMGGNLLLYFLRPSPTGYKLQLDLFGVSNDLGALATLILVALLVTSNDLSLRQLRGRRWKTLQRFNYGLFPLTAAHTFAYQVVSSRQQPFVIAAIGLVVVTLAAQAIGFWLHRRRARQRLHRPNRAGF